MHIFAIKKDREKPNEELFFGANNFRVRWGDDATLQGAESLGAQRPLIKDLITSPQGDMGWGKYLKLREY